MAQNPLQIPDVDNEVLREADEYLRKHKLLELFEVSKYNLINVSNVLIVTGPHYHLGL